MEILLENINLPEQGRAEINLHRLLHINISAQAAKLQYDQMLKHFP